MRAVVCLVAVLAIGSAVRAEPIRIESVDFQHHRDTDDFIISVAFSRPLSLPEDSLGFVLMREWGGLDPGNDILPNWERIDALEISGESFTAIQTYGLNGSDTLQQIDDFGPFSATISNDGRTFSTVISGEEALFRSTAFRNNYRFVSVDFAIRGADGEYDAQGKTLFMPVPEPSSILLASLGVVGLLAYRFRRCGYNSANAA